MTILAENNAMLNQLRVMHQERNANRQPQYQYQEPPQRQAEPVKQEPDFKNEANTTVDDNAYYEKIMAEVEPTEIGGIVEKPLQTIE